MFNHLINLFYPRLCCGCSLPLQKGEPVICIACKLELPRTGYFLNPQNPVAKMFTGRFSFAGSGALFIFEKGNVVQRVMHQLKYKGNKEAGEYMGKELGVGIAEAGWLKEITHVVPIPLHPKKKALRGYNQSAIIANALAQTCNLAVNENLLERAVYSETQTRQKKYSRWSSVQDIFIAGKEVPPKGAHILLVDDVVTTGSTVEACAAILGKNENVKVSLAVVAYAAVN